MSHKPKKSSKLQVSKETVKDLKTADTKATKVRGGAAMLTASCKAPCIVTAANTLANCCVVRS